MVIQGMKILLFSPMELPFTVGARYTGLERLAVEFSGELTKQGHTVSLLAHKDTSVPQGVKLLDCEGYINNDRTTHAEQKAFMVWQSAFYNYDVIWDIGHLHLIARFMNNLPTVNVLNHAPEHAHYEKAPYNIVSWSKWGVGQFRKYYHQEARYQETIMIDPSIYKPSGKPRGDRFLTLGRMSADKGNLRAAVLAKKMGFPLDIVGGRGSEVARGQKLTEYEAAIVDMCDGKQLRFMGEVSDEEKIELMQSCKALLYTTDHTEITSHKIQEAMMCGAPVIVPNRGGIPEIVTNGVDGYLCNDDGEYALGVVNVDKLDPTKTHEAVAAKYNRENVTRDYVKLFEEVANGLRWK